MSWKSFLQHVVALSTTEAEYIAATKPAKEALWMKGLVTKLGLELDAAVVFCDSQSAIQLSKNQVFHKRTEHIDVRLHFLGDEIAKGSIKLMKIPTDENPSDMLTKTVTSIKFKKCLNLIGVDVVC